MHDSPAAAGKLTTPVGTTDEDHVGSITDMVVYLFFLKNIILFFYIY